MDNRTDPVIVDLIKWLKENLPPDVDEEAIFKKVRRVQKIFDTLIGLSFEEFYNHAISGIQPPRQEHEEEEEEEDDEGDAETNTEKREQRDDCQNVVTLEEAVSERLNEMREYINLNEEKLIKTQRLNASRAKLDLKKEQHQLIKSIRLDGCMDLISRYNRLISKK